MGTPLLLNELLWSGGMTMLDQCYSVRGLEVVSAFNISSTVGNLFFCAFIAMGNAISIIVGQLLGAGELERAVDEDRKLIAFSLALSVGVGLLMALVAPLIPQAYNTTDHVRGPGGELLLVYAAMMPLYAYTNACYFTLRSGGKTVITFLFDSLFVWVVSDPGGLRALPLYGDADPAHVSPGGGAEPAQVRHRLCPGAQPEMGGQSGGAKPKIQGNMRADGA